MLALEHRSWETFRFTLLWTGLVIEVCYCPYWLGDDGKVSDSSLAQLEIDANRQPLPITPTGYKSNFDRADNIAALGGQVLGRRA